MHAAASHGGSCQDPRAARAQDHSWFCTGACTSMQPNARAHQMSKLLWFHLSVAAGNGHLDAQHPLLHGLPALSVVRRDELGHHHVSRLPQPVAPVDGLRQKRAARVLTRSSRHDGSARPPMCKETYEYVYGGCSGAGAGTLHAAQMTHVWRDRRDCPPGPRARCSTTRRSG